MTHDEFISILYSDYTVVRDEIISATAHWVDLAFGDKFIAVEVGKNLIGISIIDESAHFGGHDRTFVDPPAALAYIQSLHDP